MENTLRTKAFNPLLHWLRFAESFNNNRCMDLGHGPNRIYAIILYLSPCKIVHCYISVGGFNDFCVFNFLKFKSRTPIAVLKVRKQGETDILLPEVQKVLWHTAAKLSHDLGLSKLLFCRSLITNCQEMKSICLQKGFFLSQRRESDLF